MDLRFSGGKGGKEPTVNDRFPKNGESRQCDIRFSDPYRNELGFCTVHRFRGDCSDQVQPNRAGTSVRSSTLRLVHREGRHVYRLDVLRSARERGYIK